MEQKNENKPILMPGPQFNGNKKSWIDWIRKNSQKIVLGLIVVLLAIGGYFIYKNYRERQNLLKPALEEMFNSPSPSASQSPAQNLGAAPTKSKSAEVTPTPSPIIIAQTPIPKTSENKIEIVKKDSNIIAKAGKGSGATHLARSALTEYLKDKPDLQNKLLPEQKIYIEDYLQKQTANGKHLKIGEELTFSDTLIKNAIEKAQSLNQNQIKNLHKYVLLVPSLT